MSFTPCIKWSGSKRPIAHEIVSLMPDRIGTFYEPFCGGASVTRALIERVESGKVVCDGIVCSDLNNDLITLWNAVREAPGRVSEHYDRLWHEMNSTDDKNAKKAYFNSVRERLNREHNPLDFMFIMRTTTNGMPRYNQKGEFNNSFHVSRNGIEPDRLAKIVEDWSIMLNRHDVRFVCQPFEDVRPSEDDFVYLDPPYFNTKGMYYGGIDNEALFSYIRDLPCRYILSYDGISGTEDNTYDVPKDLYREHLYVRSGNSSFKRMMTEDKRVEVVYESLYKNY